ncbi:hypothetical protein BASA61_003703 [Batrachochytrium salamandrivorans]|nr:hypothetical protein BASA61_003703 [Batrachochytrium salamandrivorans]
MVLSQRHYLQDILEQFQMSNYHPAATLAEVSNTLVAAQEQEGHTASPYYETVGSPIYAMIATRPDISAAISQVSNTCTIQPTLTGRQSNEYSAILNTF